ncbi:hypothetical protein EI94DRAFT_1708414 [Lactarius quietus]|nr:hypothetical protein EI94DRAFT_1708414 [Lactarius quietus]
MTTLRAALLNPEFGFTIQDDFNEPAYSGGGGRLTNEPDGHRTTPVHSSDDRQVQGSHDKGQAAASVGAEQPVEGWRLTQTSQCHGGYLRGGNDRGGSNDWGVAMTGGSNDQGGSNDRGAAMTKGQRPRGNNVRGGSVRGGPAGPNYGIGGLDTINPASYEPLGMGQGQLFNLTCVKGSNNGQPLTFDISSYTMPDFTNNGSNFMVTDSASVSKDNPVHPFMSDNNNASFRDAKPLLDKLAQQMLVPSPPEGHMAQQEIPPKDLQKQERASEPPGYEEFRLTMNHIKDNPSAVRSWTFAVDFMEDYQKSCLVNGAYQKISKLDITRALSVGTSWFHDANKAVEILKKFGEGGTHSSQEVIDRISFTAGAPEGSTSLLRWLRTWETENPI